MNEFSVIPISSDEWREVKYQIKTIAEKVNQLAARNEKELMTPAEIMKLLGIGRTTFDRYVNNGLLPVTRTTGKIKSRLYVKRSDYERLIYKDSD